MQSLPRTCKNGHRRTCLQRLPGFRTFRRGRYVDAQPAHDFEEGTAATIPGSDRELRWPSDRRRQWAQAAGRCKLRRNCFMQRDYRSRFCMRGRSVASGDAGDRGRSRLDKTSTCAWRDRLRVLQWRLLDWGSGVTGRAPLHHDVVAARRTQEVAIPAPTRPGERR